MKLNFICTSDPSVSASISSSLSHFLLKRRVWFLILRYLSRHLRYLSNVRAQCGKLRKTCLFILTRNIAKIRKVIAKNRNFIAFSNYSFFVCRLSRYTLIPASLIRITMDAATVPSGHFSTLCRIGRPSSRITGARIPWSTNSLPLKRYDCMLVMISIDRFFAIRERYFCLNQLQPIFIFL